MQANAERPNGMPKCFRKPHFANYMYEGLLRLWRETRRSFEVSTFSDHIVCSIDKNSDFLGYLYNSVVDFYMALVANIGVLSRGAITVGQLVRTKEIIFGPALMRGYELEQGTAIYPRIIRAQSQTRVLDWK